MDWKFPYASTRVPVFAANAVATGHPLAAQAGLLMLQRGGNAIDAALAAAISLTVLEPVAAGIGGDAFAMIWDGQTLHAINGSGRSSAGATAQAYAGCAAMPTKGLGAVTVPGAVATWIEMSARFGRLPLQELFGPAIDYAQHGFLVPAHIGRLWRALLPSYAEYPAIQELYTHEGFPPRAGERMRLPRHAESLREIAQTRGESFYRGRLADLIVQACAGKPYGLTREDLASHVSDWVETLQVGYRGHEVHEIPPNSQGLAALLALGILNHFDVRQYGPDSADSLHLQIEAMKLAFSDAYHYVGDPASMPIDGKALLDPAYMETRAGQIDPARARFPKCGKPRDTGTVYLATGDREGLMVSMMQSNGFGFGSGIVAPGTGICLHSRGSAFSLEAGHPNQIGPRKRPFHTIVPAFITKAGKPVMSFGVMGFNMQPQAHLQMVTRLLDHQQNPQAVCDAPRWRIAYEQDAIVLEPGLPAATVADLAARGHRIIETESHFTANSAYGSQQAFGSAQLIYRLEDGYCAASDPRRDGQAAGW